VARKLEIQIVGDTKDLERALGRASKQTESFGKSLGGIGKTAGLAAGAAGIGALVAGLKVGIDEYGQASKVAAQTNEVIKTTGGVANVTKKHVDELATSIMKKSGIDDEAIKSTENLLLAFTGVRDEAGKGNKVFDRATQVITDYSVRTGKSASSATQIFGKALNEIAQGQIPTSIRGIGKFSDSLKDNMKAMVKHGDTVGAQKLLLGELEKRFGGAAEAAGKTLPGQINIAKETFRNWMGDLVAKAIPVLERVIGWLKDHWPEIQKALQSFWDSAKPILKGLMDLLAAAWPIAKKAIELFLPILKDVGQTLSDLIKLVTALIHGDWSKAWDMAKKVVVDVVTEIKDYLITAVTIWWTVLKPVLETVFVQPFKNAWGAVTDWFNSAAGFVGKIVSFIGGLPKKAWDAYVTVMETVYVKPFKAAWSVVSDWIGAADGFVGKVAGFIGGLPKKAWDAFTGVFDKIFVTPFKNAFNAVSDWIGGAKGWVERVAGYVGELPGKIKDFGADLLKTITGYVTNSGIAKFLTDKVTDFAHFFEGLPGKIGDALVSGAKGAVGKVKGWFSDLFGWLPGWAKDILGIHSPSKVFEDIGEHIVGGLMKGLGNMAGALKKKVESVVGAPIDWARKAIGTITDLVTGGAVGTANRTIQLPASFTPTHETMGLPGYPAIDVMAPGGTVALSPAAGKIVKTSGHPFSDGWSNGPGSAIGLSMYLMSRAGEYFMTHFSSRYVGDNAIVGAGTPLGVVGPMDDYGVAAHIHEGFHAFAKGGIVTRPTFGLIGEAGPEAVIPLNRMGAPAINIYVAGTVVSENQLVDAVYRGLVRKSGRNAGNLGLA
jgi:phage-related protein